MKVTKTLNIEVEPKACIYYKEFAKSNFETVRLKCEDDLAELGLEPELIEFGLLNTTSGLWFIKISTRPLKNF